MPGIPGPVTQPQPQEVARALDWLVRTQEEDGSWNPKKWEGQELYRVGLTGLALLAFSGEDAGNANADAVGRAADYLVTQQDKSGRFGPFFSNAPYNHGIATVALLETWARTKDARLKQPIERALIFIGRHQHPTGGWGYLSIDRKINTSVTAWQLHAVLLADALGWPEARPSVEKGLAWIAGVVDREGRAGYERTGDFPEGPKALTAMAAFCLSVGAKHPTETAADAAVVRSLAKIADDATDAEKVDFYRSYFLSHALGVARRRGFSEGTKLGDLTAQLNRTLAARQLTEGPNAGSWDPADQWSSAGGRVYATAMAALSLQSENRTERLTGRIRRH